MANQNCKICQGVGKVFPNYDPIVSIVCPDCNELQIEQVGTTDAVKVLSIVLRDCERALNLARTESPATTQRIIDDALQTCREARGIMQIPAQ